MTNDAITLPDATANVASLRAITADATMIVAHTYEAREAASELAASAELFIYSAQRITPEATVAATLALMLDNGVQFVDDGTSCTVCGADPGFRSHDDYCIEATRTVE